MSETPRAGASRDQEAAPSPPPEVAREPTPELVPTAALAAGVALAAFALSAALAPRVTGPDDAGEFTLVLAMLGVAHPTGYPLWTLAGAAFVHLLHAVGLGWSHAANLWSACGAALAAGLWAALGVRLAGSARAGALAGAVAAALVLALHPTWLASATVAEVYSWSAAWLALAALAALGLVERAERGGLRAAHAAGWGAVAGLGLAHHLTSLAFTLPLTLALALASRRAGRGVFRLAPAVLAGAAAPLASYAFVAWRAAHPASYQWPLLAPGWRGLLEHASGGVFRRYVGGFAPEASQQAALARDLLPFAVAGLALVVALLPRVGARRRLLLALLAGVALEAAFVARYAAPDPAAYLIPVLMVALLAVPLATARLHPRLAPIAALAVALLPFALGWPARALAERARVEVVEARIRAVWRAIPFERGYVLWADDHVTRLLLYQLLERERPGVVVEDPRLLTWERPRQRFIRRAGFDPLAGLELASDADLVRVPANVARQTRLPVADFAAFAASVGR